MPRRFQFPSPFDGSAPASLSRCAFVAFVAAIPILLAGALSSSRAGELRVEPGGDGAYATIQAAIDAASPGDVVVLADGTFTGNGNVDLDFRGKSITVRSEGRHAESCAIDAGHGGSVPHRIFVFQNGETPDASVEGITLRGGTASGDVGLEGAGGAVLCKDESHPTFRNCVFRENAASSDGGAVSCRDSSPKFYGCRFEENVAPFGGAVFVERPCLLTGSPMEVPPVLLEGCTFSGNQATQGGGVYARGIHTHLIVRDVVFSGNIADQGGGAKLHGATAVLERCRLLQNWAGQEGGGLACESTLFCSPSAPHSGDEPVEVYASTSLFAGNASGVGGAALFRGYSAAFDQCTLAGNGAPSGSALAALAHYPVEPFLPSDLLVERTILAFGTGGAAVEQDLASAVRLVCSDVYGNEGGDWVGAIEDQANLDGNLNVDPLFCGAEVGNYELRTDSPCQDYPGGCGLIGAYPATCGTASGSETVAKWEGQGAIVLDLATPFHDALRGRVVVSRGGDVVLDLHDAQGRRLATEMLGWVGEEGVPIVWSPSADLPAGPYFVQARAGGDRTARKVVHAR